MNNGRAGVAFFITILALIWFSIFALYGMEYLFNGNHWMAIGLWLLGVIALIASIYFMCRSKAYRSKRRGLLIEIPSIAVAIVVLLLGSLPFTMFLSVIRHEADFVRSITETAKKVGAIDSSYQTYVGNRIAQYEDHLKRKNYRKTEISSRVNSLKRRLIPENIDSVRNERKEWLKSLDTVSIWNISTARNFYYIVKAGDDWSDQYRQHASFFYEGEDTALFDIEQSVVSSQATYTHMRTPHSPDSASLLAAVFCIVCILAAYFYIRRPRNRYSGHHR